MYGQASDPSTFVIALDSSDPSTELKGLLNGDVVHVKLSQSRTGVDFSKTRAEVERHCGGRIDILVNNAIPSKHSTKPLSQLLHGEITDEVSFPDVSVCAYSLFYSCQIC